MFSYLENLFTSSSNATANEADRSMFIMPVFIGTAMAATFWLRKAQIDNQMQENTIENLQQLLGVLTKKCDLFIEINQYEEAFNYHSKQQIEPNAIELDKSFQDEREALRDLYLQVSQLENTSADLKIKSSFSEKKLVTEIQSKKDLLNELLDKNRDLKLEAAHIQKQQERKISNQDAELEALREELTVAKAKVGFFEGSIISEKAKPDSYLNKSIPLNRMNSALYR